MSDVTLDVDGEDLFLIRGKETIKKEAKPQGNGAHVIVPKDWIGTQVKITRVTNPDHDDE